MVFQQNFVKFWLSSKFSNILSHRKCSDWNKWKLDGTISGENGGWGSAIHFSSSFFWHCWSCAVRSYIFLLQNNAFLLTMADTFRLKINLLGPIVYSKDLNSQFVQVSARFREYLAKTRIRLFGMWTWLNSTLWGFIRVTAFCLLAYHRGLIFHL